MNLKTRVPFLAAMSSSRSDDVTQSVRPSVPKEFLISLKIICSVSRMFQDCSVFQGSFKGVLRMFQGYPKEVSWMFQESFKRSATIKTQYLYFYSMYIVVL